MWRWELRILFLTPSINVSVIFIVVWINQFVKFSIIYHFKKLVSEGQDFYIRQCRAVLYE